MSTNEKPETDFTGKDYDRTLSSIRADAKKISEALTRMLEDKAKLEKGGHPASAAILGDCIIAVRVALRQMGEVFRVELG